jgi:hypothetical protein
MTDSQKEGIRPYIASYALRKELTELAQKKGLKGTWKELCNSRKKKKRKATSSDPMVRYVALPSDGSRREFVV